MITILLSKTHEMLPPRNTPKILILKEGSEPPVKMEVISQSNVLLLATSKYRFKVTILGKSAMANLWPHGQSGRLPKLVFIFINYVQQTSYRSLNEQFGAYHSDVLFRTWAKGSS